MLKYQKLATLTGLAMLAMTSLASAEGAKDCGRWTPCPTDYTMSQERVVREIYKSDDLVEPWSAQRKAEAGRRKVKVPVADPAGSSSQAGAPAGANQSFLSAEEIRLGLEEDMRAEAQERRQRRGAGGWGEPMSVLGGSVRVLR